MTRTTNSGYGIVRLDDKHGSVKPGEEGVIIATSEERVGEWLMELFVSCMKYPQVLRDATSEKKFSKQVELPGMTMAFIEVGFFGEAMIGCLDRLRKRHPQLRIVLFAISEYPPEETARYVFWGKGSFISLRDEPKEIEVQLKAIFRDGNRIPESIVQIIGGYELERDRKTAVIENNENETRELSTTAKNILKEMALDHFGELSIHFLISGTYEANTNCKKFSAEIGDLRRKKEIEEAIKELERNGFIEPKNATKKKYEITLKGIDYAKTL